MQCMLFTCSFASNRQSKYNHLRLSTPSMAAMLVAAGRDEVRGLGRHTLQRHPKQLRRVTGSGCLTRPCCSQGPCDWWHSAQQDEK